MIRILFLFIGLVGAHAEPRLIMGLTARVTSLDPFSVTGLDSFQAISQVLEPLARLNPQTHDLVPWLAESWTVNRGRKTVRVKLRREVFFQNGQRLTTQDVKFTIEAFAKPEYRGQIWQAMWDDISEVRVLSDSTFDLRMKTLHYLSFVSAMTSLRILPRSFYRPYDGAKFRTQIVGTGPFRLERFDPGQSLDLQANPKWWHRPRPEFALRIKTVTEPHLAAEMFAKGQLDEYALPTGAAVDPAQVTRLLSPLGEGLWLNLNLRHELFNSVAVRRALLKLWDRQSLNQKVFAGRYRLAADGFSPRMQTGSPKLEKYDPKAAAALLRNEGWDDRDHLGVLQKNGQPFRFQILVHSAAAERWVTLYQADAAKIGIKIDILRIEEDSRWWPRLKEGKFDAIAGEGGVSDAPDASTWHTGGAFNFSGYSNPRVDDLIAKLEDEFDPKLRHAREVEIVDLIRNDFAQIAGLYSPDAEYFLNPRVKIDSVYPTQAFRWRLKH